MPIAGGVSDYFFFAAAFFAAGFLAAFFAAGFFAAGFFAAGFFAAAFFAAGFFAAGFFAAGFAFAADFFFAGAFFAAGFFAAAFFAAGFFAAAIVISPLFTFPHEHSLRQSLPRQLAVAMPVFHIRFVEDCLHGIHPGEALQQAPMLQAVEHEAGGRRRGKKRSHSIARGPVNSAPRDPACDLVRRSSLRRMHFPAVRASFKTQDHLDSIVLLGLCNKQIQKTQEFFLRSKSFFRPLLRTAGAVRERETHDSSLHSRAMDAPAAADLHTAKRSEGERAPHAKGDARTTSDEPASKKQRASARETPRNH